MELRYAFKFRYRNSNCFEFLIALGHLCSKNGNVTTGRIIDAMGTSFGVDFAFVPRYRRWCCFFLWERLSRAQPSDPCLV
jgi:hypothetical protein